jgi:hypothetical protein
MAVTAQAVIDSFERIMQIPRLGKVEVVIFDLDGTMGSLPGWSGNLTLWEYTHHPVILQKLIRHMRHNMGLKVIMVSRNGAFCSDYKASAAEAIRMFKFDDVAECAAKYRRTPKNGFIDIDPAKTLLLDDQERECNLAAAHGGYAIKSHLLLKTLLQKTIRVYSPSQPTKRRTTRKR